MFFTFDLCLLLYVIRLAGWLKHCNLSLSLSQVSCSVQSAAYAPIGRCRSHMEQSDDLYEDSYRYQHLLQFRDTPR